MPHLNGKASQLLIKYLNSILSLGCNKEVLDLACGGGRNGLFLLKNNIPVTFVDKKEKALLNISAVIEKKLRVRHRCLQIDLETGKSDLLESEKFGAILVFNYLHRPLFPSIRSAISKGGLIFYETFTVEQREFGRPRNPDYLLQEGELLREFEGWEIIDYFDGIKVDPTRSISSLVARKP